MSLKRNYLIKLLTFFLVLFCVQSGYAAESGESSVKSEASQSVNACPVDSFSDFLHVFINSEDVQRKHTRRPLRIQQLDLDAKPEVKPVIRMLNDEQVFFPLAPLKAERDAKAINVQTDNVTAVSATVTFYETYTASQVAYEFVMNDIGCWELLSVDDRTYAKDGKIAVNWLDYVFPSVIECTPNNLFYDTILKRSNNGILEKRGYSPYQIDGHTAKYKINERFYGLNATEIAIPVGDSVYMVTVRAGAKKLSDAILGKSGKRLQMYRPGFKTESGVAYLISDDKEKSSFICYTLH